MTTSMPTIPFSQIVWNSRAFGAPPEIPRPRLLRHVHLRQVDLIGDDDSNLMYEVLVSQSGQTVCRITVLDSDYTMFREFQNAVLASRLPRG